MKPLILYCSKQGFSKKYAQQIAQGFDTTAQDLSQIKNIDLSDYSPIVFCSGIYAGSLRGLDTLAQLVKAPQTKIVVVACGLSDLKSVSNTNVLKENMMKTLKSRCSIQDIFFVNGGIDYPILSFFEKIIMKVMTGALKKKPVSERSDQDQKLIEAYGKKADFYNQNSVDTILSLLADETRPLNFDL